MDDLVKRLLTSFSVDAKEKMPAEVFRDYEHERNEAADRIEKLEAALREVVKVDCGFVCQCAEIARTALEENK